MLLVIKEGTFSALYDLFVQFNVNKKKYYTLPKDGMNNHAQWEQKFDFEIECDKEEAVLELQLEGCHGSPLDFKLLGKTEVASLKLSNEVQLHELELYAEDIFDEKKSIGKVTFSTQIVDDDKEKPIQSQSYDL